MDSENIEKMYITEPCRMCGDKEEAISHFVSTCKQLAQKDFEISRHNKVAAILHWDICKNNGFKYAIKVMNISLIMRKNFWRMKMLKFYGIVQFKPTGNWIIKDKISQ